jgi:hypothetical protein
MAREGVWDVEVQLSAYRDADWLGRELTCICSGEHWLLWKVRTFYASVGAYNSNVTGMSSLTLVR